MNVISEKREMMQIGLLLLAAGDSRRLGQPKQLLSFHGESLLRRAAQTALATPCRPVVVVTGANHLRIKREVADLSLDVVVNPMWNEASHCDCSNAGGDHHALRSTAC